MPSQQYLFPGKEWAQAYCRALNESEEYRKAGKNWTAGSILFVVEDIPEKVAEMLGSQRIGFRLDLLRGECRGVEYYTDPDKGKAEFIITAKYQDWLRVIRGELHPTTALMTRKLKVVRGNVAILLRFAQAAIAMVKAAQNVPTRFE